MGFDFGFESGMLGKFEEGVFGDFEFGGVVAEEEEREGREEKDGEEVNAWDGSDGDIRHIAKQG
ncbi:hypothetical protein, partial [Neisseria sicca]|uniref:hypothetical protein n=1 Tax=Neisseria sicca TaxID=490 RepID=UPI0011BD152E